MLDMVNCKILSVLESEAVDAYLLSESSMFVFPHKLILKTCGTTTLLLGLQRMLHIAAANAGFPFYHASSVTNVKAAATPYRVFYSRKNFLFPDKQRGPHKSWGQEVKFLDEMFDGGSAYMVGKMNGDHWYLYITSPNQALTPVSSPDGGVVEDCIQPLEGKNDVGSSTENDAEHHDETLEILMTDLDPEYAKQFYLENASAIASKKLASEAQDARRIAKESLGGFTEESGELDVFDNTARSASNGNQSDKIEAMATEGHALGMVVSESCGLSDVYPSSSYPDARVDAYLFGPCGFSANGVVPPPQEGEKVGANKTGHYFTVHVTPEANCSYASFETNVPGGQSGRTTAEIIQHMVGIFNPGRFSVTLFEAKGQSANPYGMETGNPNGGLASKRLVDPVKGYRRIDRIVHDFEDYDLVFRFYEREDWLGEKGARVGEVCL